MVQVDINLWSVLVAGIAVMALGALWYSQSLFGKKWLSSMGKTPSDWEAMKKNASRAYAFSFIGILIMAYILARFVKYMNVTSVSGALELSFWLWLGFIATVGFNGILFEKHPKSLFLINTGYQLASLIIMSIIIALW